MSQSQKFELDIITKVASGLVEPENAAKLLKKSPRTIRRLLKGWKDEGAAFVLHGNKGRKPVNCCGEDTKTLVRALVEGKYFDFNMSHALEMLRDEEKVEGLNRESFRRWCHEWKIVKHKVKRRSKARYLRGRHKQVGMMLQMDGSYHRWYGSEESCLIAVIDDATSSILHLEFFDAETTDDCMAVLSKVIERYGIFTVLYTDKAGVFGGGKRVEFTQLQSALEELGVNVLYANSPEAKGRIERLFKTLQDRLVPLMRLKKITSRTAANKFVHGKFLKEHNRKFSVAPQDPVSAFKPVPPQIDLKEVFCLKYGRTLQKDHTVAFEGQTYLVKSPIRYSLKKSIVEVRVYPNKEVRIFYGCMRLDATRITGRYNFDEIEKIKARWKKTA